MYLLCQPIRVDRSPVTESTRLRFVYPGGLRLLVLNLFPFGQVLRTIVIVAQKVAALCHPEPSWRRRAEGIKDRLVAVDDGPAPVSTSVVQQRRHNTPYGAANKLVERKGVGR